MKKSIILLAVAGLFALSSCSDEKGGVTEPDFNSDGKSYIKINIAPAKTTGTRAEEEGTDNGNIDEYEKNINNLRFYFFKEGRPVPVNATGFNWVEHTPGEISDDNPANQNIDRTLSAIAILQLPKDSEKPDQMVTIANPESFEELNDNKSYSLEELSGLAADLSGTSNGLVMTTSVYLDNKDIINYTELHPDDFKSTMEEAMDESSPVKVYLDRALAKVQVIVNFKPQDDDTNSLIEFTDEETGEDKIGYLIGEYGIYNGETTENKSIYVVFLGWNATQTAKESFLVKNIENSWTDTSVFPNWNDVNNFRSYWAKNPGNMDFGYLSLFEGTSQKLEEGVTVYVQENAPGTGEDKVNKPTRVFVGAKFVDQDGKDLQVAELANQKMTADNLGPSYLSMYLAKNGKEKLYKIVGEEISEVVGSEIGFKTATAVSEITPEYGAYYVYPCVDTVTKDNEAIQYSWDEEGETLISDINSELKSLGHAKYWKYGYYYFDIIHYDARDNETIIPGVIRNHFYKCEISGVKGWGTPVLDPEETIYPERPETDDFVISAQINVLSWKEYNHEYELE